MLERHAIQLQRDGDPTGERRIILPDQDHPRPHGSFDGIYAIIRERIVLDTNAFVSALLSGGSAPRALLRLCLDGDVVPLMGNALFAEYEDLLARDRLFAACPVDRAGRSDLFEALLNCCKWTEIFYGWRLNLRDEGDNHLIELAVAGGAGWLVTGNQRHFLEAELVFPDLKIVSPRTFLDRWR